MSKKEVRDIPAVQPRLETGAVRAGTDWTGYFIRGDNCMAIIQAINMIAIYFAKQGIDPRTGPLGDLMTHFSIRALIGLCNDMSENALEGSTEWPATGELIDKVMEELHFTATQPGQKVADTAHDQLGVVKKLEEELRVARYHLNRLVMLERAQRDLKQVNNNE